MRIAVVGGSLNRIACRTGGHRYATGTNGHFGLGMSQNGASAEFEYQAWVYPTGDRTVQLSYSFALTGRGRR